GRTGCDVSRRARGDAAEKRRRTLQSLRGDRDPRHHRSGGAGRRHACMDRAMSRICSVCARGGSKGVRNKNTRELAGRPLIVHTLEQARSTGLFKLIAVSSDSAEILDLARTHGADLTVERPPELASDTAAKIPAIRHCVAAAEKA